MKKPSFQIAILAGFLIVPLQFLTPQQSAMPQDGPQRTLQFENDDVAVWKAVVAPNGPLSMHTHEHPRVIVAVAGGPMKIVFEDGTSEMHQWESGKAYWLSKEEGRKKHADVNTGSKPIEVMVVELKKSN